MKNNRNIILLTTVLTLLIVPIIIVWVELVINSLPAIDAVAITLILTVAIYIIWRHIAMLKASLIKRKPEPQDTGLVEQKEACVQDDESVDDNHHGLIYQGLTKDEMIAVLAKDKNRYWHMYHRIELAFIREVKETETLRKELDKIKKDKHSLDGNLGVYKCYSCSKIFVVEEDLIAHSYECNG